MGDITNKPNGVDDNMDIDSGALENETHKLPDRQPGVSTDKLKISYENYKKITNLLVMHMNQDEEKNSDKNDWNGIKQSQLVEWYFSKYFKVFQFY